MVRALRNAMFGPEIERLTARVLLHAMSRQENRSLRKLTRLASLRVLHAMFRQENESLLIRAPPRAMFLLASRSLTTLHAMTPWANRSRLVLRLPGQGLLVQHAPHRLSAQVQQPGCAHLAGRPRV